MASVIVDLLLRSGSFESDSDRAAKALDKLGKQAVSVSKGIDKQVASLELQAATYHMSTRESTLYELALKGASTQQLQAAQSALAYVEAQDKLAVAGKFAVKSILAIGAAIGGFVVGAGIAFDQLLKGAGHFQDLSEETGTSAENIASFALAAAGAGVSMDSIAAASIKLTKNLTGVDDESKAAGAALAALGLNIADFKRLDPADQYEKVGKALAGFADGAGKTAIAVALFGKAGAEQLKVFKQLEEQGGRQNILTAEQIALSDAYGDAQAISTKKLQLYAQAIAADAIPAVTALQGVVIDLAKELLNTSGAADKLGSNKSVLDWAREAALGVAGFVDSLRNTGSEISAFVAATEKEFVNLKYAGKLLTSSPDDLHNFFANNQGPLADVLKERNRIISDANKSLLDNANKDKTKIQDALKAQFAIQDAASGFAKTASSFGGGKAGKLPELAFNGADTSKAIRGSDRASEAERYLESLRKQLQTTEDLTTVERVLADIQSGRLKGLSASIAGQALDIAGQIDQHKHLTEQLKAEKDQLRILQQAEKQLADEGRRVFDTTRTPVEKYNTEIERLSGLYHQGAIDADTYARATTAASDAIAGSKIDQLTSDFSLSLGKLQIAEDRLSLSQKYGVLGELDGLARSGAERKKAIDIIQAQIDAFDRLGNVGRTDKQVQQIEQLRVKLEELKATVDPLALKINGVFEDAFSGAFADFISGTKSATHAFQDFGKSVLSELTKMASKDIAHSIFGGSGGIGGGLSSLFGGGSSSGSGGNPFGNLGSLFSGGFSSFFNSIPASATGTVVTDDALALFFNDGGYTGNKGTKEAAGVVHGKEFVFSAPAVKALGVGYLDHLHEQAKLGHVAGFESGGFVGSLKPYNAGATYKEPDAPGGKPTGKTQINHISIAPPAGMSRDSAQQIGASIARQLAIADRRNN